MAVEDALIARLRSMAGELGKGNYTPAQFAEYIERYPVADDMGILPFVETEPPISEPGFKGLTTTTGWTPTYDLHAAAAEVWRDKAAAIADNSFDFSEAGATYNRSQRMEQYIRKANYHEGRKCARTIMLRKWPAEAAANLEGELFNEGDAE